MARKHSTQAAEAEKAVQTALQALSNGQHDSVSKAARVYNITERTLRRRWNGRLSRATGLAHQQLLTDNEEKALGRWVSELIRNGFLSRHGTIREMAEEIRNTRITKVNDSSIQLE